MDFSRLALVRGSCLASTSLPALPDDSIDVAIFDPPYAEKVHSKSRRGQTPHYTEPTRPGATAAQFNRVRDLGFAHLTAKTRTLVTQHLARLVKRWSVVFADLESDHLWGEAAQAAGLEWVRTCGWIKEGATPQFTGDRPAAWAEAIVILHRPGRKRWNGGGRHGGYSCPIVLDRGGSGERRLHTAQKPLGLMEALVRDFTERGELVLDPFAGSGTTGVAALKHGRRFFGYERDRRYHALAAERLRFAREQLGLFPEAPSSLESPIRHSFDDIATAMLAKEETDTDGLVTEATKEQGHGM